MDALLIYIRNISTVVDETNLHQISVKICFELPPVWRGDVGTLGKTALVHELFKA